MPNIQNLMLASLKLAGDNVRKAAPNSADHDTMVGSIRAHGLLENLIVRAVDDDAYEVVAGGRRLAALRELAENGEMKWEEPIPCLILENGEDQGSELSLAENAVRIPMHPADQVTAFARLHEQGRSVQDIAARFGATERVVEQRLRLGSVHPDLLEAYRGEKITLETLMAFTIAAGHPEQLAAYEQLKNQPYRIAPHQVRSLLTDEKMRADMHLAKFVGIEAYEAAGGAVVRDLFAEHVISGTYLEDVQLVHKLAHEKLEAEAEKLRETWKWAEAHLSFGWEEVQHYGKLKPTPGELTDAEAKEMEAADERLAELSNTYDESDLTPEQQIEFERLERRQDEVQNLVEARAAFEEADYARGGAIVTVDYSSNLKVVLGLVRKEDLTDADKQTSQGARAASGGGTSYVDPRKAALKDAGIGQGLADDMRWVRQALVKAHVGKDFNAAFDLATFTMANSLFRKGSLDPVLDLVADTTSDSSFGANRTEFEPLSPGLPMIQEVEGKLKLEWMQIEDRAESFAAFVGLTPAQKKAIFAACVARTIEGQLTFEHGPKPELESIIERLKINFGKLVRPGAKLFWSRLAKDKILQIGRGVLGEDWMAKHSKLKKGELADVMETAFSADPPAELMVGSSKEQRAAAKVWAMPGFAPKQDT